MSIEINMGETVVKPINWIKPYWRNPRRVPEEAVNALAESIRQYGYQQPIVVDAEGVIIIGHTRYAACRKLGLDEVPVLVTTHLSAKQVKQLRVIDNRVAEFTSWDLDALTDELGDLDATLLRSYFPEMNPGDWEADAGNSIVEDPSKAWENVNSVVGFTCPTCFHMFETEVSREDILNGKIEAKS